MKWEYLVRKLSAMMIDGWGKGQDETEEKYLSLRLSRFNKEGWELVSVDNGVAYFKRPIKVSEKEDVELEKHKEFIKKLTLQQIDKMNRQEFNRRFSRVEELYNLESS